MIIVLRLTAERCAEPASVSCDSVDSVLDWRDPFSTQQGAGRLVEGVLAAWMPASSLQGRIYGVPWNEPPRPVAF